MPNINRYNVQYWLYAILNKQYGELVTLHRSYVARTYDVNKHDFEIATIFNNDNDALELIRDFLVHKLIDAGYQEKNGFFEKLFGNKRVVIRLKYGRMRDDKYHLCASSWTYSE
jgi:hypothetical protein